MQLADQVALVTGAGSGIGRAIAAALAREGARVAVNDIREDAAQETVAAIAADGGRAMAVPADVADGRAALKMFTRFLTVWNTLDLVVNNAGVAFIAPHVAESFAALAAEVRAGGPPTTPLSATATLEDGLWRRTLAVHLDGTFHCTREALKVMEVRRRGKIINMASVAGTAGLAGAPDYSAAKGGIIAFTKSVAREVAHLGIQVNAIAPGFVDTPLLAELAPAIAPRHWRRRRSAASARRRRSPPPRSTWPRRPAAGSPGRC
ncbi:MAG: SDR family NAD(P)-dependent oxidoreductase [Candidatus Binatia bacterium]